MKRFVSVFALFLTTALLSVNVWAQSLSQFSYDESNALMWQQRYAAAPAGSWEEAQARQSRDMAIQRAIQDVNLYSFQGMDYRQIESFADQMNSKYAAAPAGGAIESMYRQVRDTSYQAFNQALQSYVQYINMGWRELMNLAQQLDSQYAAAPAGSQKESAYNQARHIVYQRVPQAINMEISQTYDFRAVENLATYFDSQYAAAAAGSLKESVYNQARQSAYQQAGQKFSQQAYSMPMYQLYQIQDEYNSKYNAARAGSLQESYYRQVRDTARSLIH